MDIHRVGEPPTVPAPEATFTGHVAISGYFTRATPSRLAGATATFAPGARTPWKTNPLGQTLVVTDGVGLVQTEGEQIAEVRPGDVIWCAPGERHWEGATPEQAMTYVALQESAHVDFGAAVDDRTYDGPRAGR